MTKRKTTCPNKTNHTHGPFGYAAWHEWAEKMAETHVQEQCPECRFWVIWTPKEEAA